MQDFKIRSNAEAKTIEMMHKVRSEADDSATVIIANLFEHLWSASLDAEHITEIAKAIYRFDLNFQPVLTKLCRQKVLRSRRTQGKTYYEVNY